MTDESDAVHAYAVQADRLQVDVGHPPLIVGFRERRAPTVLHVVRNMGGGLAQAVYDYSESTPMYRHVLLAHLEDAYQIGKSSGHFAEAHTMPRGARSAMTCIRGTIARIEPDVIHAHSSFAGAFVRSVVPRRLRSRVIYTPHCYAFERRDINLAARALYYGIEWILTQRCPHIVACSPQEQRSANRISRSITEYVPNVVHSSHRLPSQRRQRDRPLIVAAGRMCPQKHPQLFVQAALRSREMQSNVDWLWLGGGDTKYESMFERAGVPFTGWLDRSEILNRLRDASIYVHTAAWEGAPLTVLEAAAANLPVLARDIPALRALGVAALWRDLDELLAMVEQYPDGPVYAAAHRTNNAITVRHVRALQTAGLELAYTRVLTANGQLVSK